MVDESVVKKKFFEVANRYIENNKISHAYLIELNDYEKDFSDIL